MNGTIRPYEGAEPYIFVSYSHKNSRRVTQIIEALNREGYRVWYDTGIHAGSRWTDEIAQHIDNCAVFLPLHSRWSVQSEFCTNEIGYARKMRKEIVPVYIEKVALTPGLELLLHGIQHISLYPKFDMEAFLARMELEPVFRPCHEPKQMESEPQTDGKQKRPLFILPVFLAILLAAIVFWPILNRSADTQNQILDPVWNLDENGTLTISKAKDSDGVMPDYPWDYYNDTSTAPWITYLDADQKILEIVIQDGITSIGSQAFQGCSDVVRISVPSSVTAIGSSAFSHCGELTEITIPDNVTAIEDFTFFGCTGLTEITIPDSVTSIGENSFYECAGLTEITIPDGVISIGGEAFDGCTGLTEITIPGKVTAIDDYTFARCTGLNKITIPDSVTSIGWFAFLECEGLTEITIPVSVTEIGEGAFSKCVGLTKITIPDSVKSIGWDAFLGCVGLTKITIPDGVTEIGNSTFYGCAGLIDITIPDSLVSICLW